MSLRDDYVQTLERENAELRERIALLEEMLGVRIEVPIVFDLTGQEERLLGILLKRELFTKGAALTFLYGHRPDTDEAEQKIIDVFICHMRRKLKPFGIAIETKRGDGYYMTAAAKAKVRAPSSGGRMSLTTDHGNIVFECEGCHATLETNTSNFEAARNVLRREQWQPRRLGGRGDETGEWQHFCKDCK